MSASAPEAAAVTFVYDDGGRAAAGFAAEPRGCAVGPIAIVTGLEYRGVHAALSVRGDPDHGVPAFVVDDFLERRGFTYDQPEPVPGRPYATVGDLPRVGSFIVRFVMHRGAWVTSWTATPDGTTTAHLSALVDGELRDDVDTRHLPLVGWWSR